MDNSYCQQFNEIERLKTIEADLKKQQARWSETEQKLSIGIMGQVKAGKSSFANALLFNGRPILPEAATPKTANLTKISYGEHFCLKVDYYTKQEWDDIKRLAELQSQSVEAKVAKELVEMARGIDSSELQRCLTINTESRTTESIDGLQGLLNQYAGNDGCYTPLVKSTEISLPMDELKGFEVVDTPGMNDPVASRTQKTREYMANCDVVFFLSRCSQFLDKADDELLRNQLPNKGVKRLILVAGQFDSTILDDGYDRDSLQETVQNIINRQTRHAVKKAQEIAESKVTLNQQQMEMVHNSLSKPVFASTFAHGYATWPKETWSKSMLHTFEQLTELAEDEWDYELTQQDWLNLANFEALQHAFHQAKSDRQALLDQQKRNYLPNAYQNMLTQYDSLINSITQRVKFIQTKDVASIEKEQKECEKKAASIATILTFTLTQAKNEAKQEANELINQLKKDQLMFSQLTTREGTREVEESYSVSTSRWYNPFSWGSRETRYRTRTVTYQYHTTHDAIEQINQYGAESAGQIVSLFSKIISPTHLKLKLKQALINELDTHREEFDPMVFKSILENFINKLDLPTLDVNLGDTSSLIANSFHGEITSSSEMEQLRTKLSQALSTVLEKLQCEFEKQFNAVIDKLDSAGEGLAGDLSANLQQELEKMKQQIKDKEKEVLDYLDYLEKVESDKKAILARLAIV
ncbi:dynamin family protein [Vibrio metschnikovii]|uniref:Dynamin family protein n=2 Tax=Unclassified Bacteria TaxID=49928 RepID=A0AAU6UZC4_UNCXX|nr:dynamin family protein [Vibrio metschnikovii]